MKCLECGGDMVTGRQNHRYDACGLPGITIVDVEVSRCQECGGTEVAIPNVEGLHRAIAQGLARKRERLTSAEVRFLRKWLGLSGVDFARYMGVTPETVSRWEQGATPVGATAERLLRWLVMTREPVSEYPLDLLKDAGIEKAKSIKMGLKVNRGRWQSFIGPKAALAGAG